MQIAELERNATSSGEMISIYKSGETKIKLISAFGDDAALEDFLFNLACQKISRKITVNT